MRLRKSEKATILEIKEYIDGHFTEKTTIQYFSKKYKINAIKLQNGFQFLFKNTIHAYQVKLRMTYAASLLLENEMIVKEIAYSSGYVITKFGSTFKKYFGLTPTSYRRKHTDTNPI
jgi:YesN/AraC family two-component response regulator